MAGNARRGHRLRQRARLQAAEARERMLHRHRAAEQLGRSGVRAEFAPAREPRDDDRRDDAEQDLAHEHGDRVAEARPAVAAAAAEHEVVDEEANDAREEHDKSVHHTLDQRQRDHVTIGHVGDLVAQHSLHFLAVHVGKQARRHRDQRGIFKGARREGIRFAVVDGHFRHGNARALREITDGAEQPCLGGIARLLDDARAGGHFGHRLAHQQGNDGTREAHDEREHEQRPDVDALPADGTSHAEDVQHDRQHEHDGKVGGEEQQYALHLGRSPAGFNISRTR